MEVLARAGSATLTLGRPHLTRLTQSSATSFNHAGMRDWLMKTRLYFSQPMCRCPTDRSTQIINMKNLKLGTRITPRSSSLSHKFLKHATDAPNVFVGQFACIRQFHTTQPCHIGLPPLLWLVARNVVKVIIMLGGRRTRKWWNKLPEETRRKYFLNFLGQRHRIGFYGTILAAVTVIYYYSHCEKTPITGRSRFLALTSSQFETVTKYQEQMIMRQLKPQLVHARRPVYQKVERVVRRILHSNADLDIVKDKKWSITVVDDPETRNAFVLPNGHIFVCSGMLKIAANDDQLAMVLAHEMSHALLSHAVEQVSFAQFLDMFIIIAVAAIWVVLPTDILAAFTHGFFEKVVDVMLHLPYSRTLEREADNVGLQLAAKACFDVREAPAFWMRMQMLGEASNDPSIHVPEFLSTHPTHLNRVEYVDGLVPGAVALRRLCNCPPLSPADPRRDIERVQRMLNKEGFENDMEQFLRRIRI